MILSFAWTTDALLAGRKTCTRRVWKDAHFQFFGGEPDKVVAVVRFELVEVLDVQS